MGRRHKSFRSTRHMAEALERRTLLAAVSWTAQEDGDWFTPSNWSTNTVPGADDDVTINVPGEITVRLSAGFDAPIQSPVASVRSLATAENVSLEGTSLSVTHGVKLLDNAALTVATAYRDLHSISLPSSLQFTGDQPQMLDGQGRVLIFGGLRGVDSGIDASAALTIASGITVAGADGAINGTIVNEGLITGGSPNFNGDAYMRISGDFTNNGTVGVSGDILLDTSGFHPGTGMLVAQNADATISFTGSFTQRSLGKLAGATDFPHFIVANGGNLTGGLTLDATSGSWAFQGGTMTGGNYRASDSAYVDVRGAVDALGAVAVTSTFDGVSLGGDLTVGHDATLNITNDLKLMDDARIHLSAGGGLQFLGGQQNLSGQGQVLFEGGVGAAPVMRTAAASGEASSSLTTDAGITIRVNGGGVIGDDASSSSITSNGMILAANGAITVQGNFVNHGTLRVDGGGRLDLKTQYAGDGRFEVNAGFLLLSGSFKRTDFGDFVRTGGQVLVTGTITGGLALNADTGSWDISGGTLVGGVCTASGGASVRAFGNGATLDGVTIATDFFATDAGITVADDLTLANHARIILARSLAFMSDATLGGHGDVILVDGAPRIDVAQDASLTIGPGVAIRCRGRDAFLGNGRSPIVNQGLIVVEAAGATFGIDDHLINEGMVRVNAGTLYVSGAFTQARLGDLANAGGEVNISGTFTGGLKLNASTGSWNLAGGTFSGRYSASDGAKLSVTREATFDDVTVASDLDVINSHLSINDNLTLADGAVVHLITSGGKEVALDFVNSPNNDQTLGGQGEVRLEDKSIIRTLRVGGAGRLTIGSEVTIRAVKGLGTIGETNSSALILNTGVVSTEGAQASISFKGFFENRGVISSSDRASLVAVGNFRNPGSLTLRPGTVFNVAPSGSFETTGVVTFQISGTAQSGQFGRIASGAGVTLFGAANIEIVGGGSYQPVAGDAYPIIQFPRASVSFTTVNGLVINGLRLFTQNVSSTAFTLVSTGQVDLLSPSVTDVFVSSAGWVGTFRQTLAAQRLGDSALGFRVGAGGASDLPWPNLDRVSVRFNRPVAIESSDLTITGVRTAKPSIASFKYDPSTRTATWTLAAPLGADNVLLTLKSGADGVASPDNGKMLDGDYLGQLPAGDGVDGGDFRLRFDVLPGDVNRSGSVNASDLVQIRNRVGQNGSGPGSGFYSVFSDLGGDGIINASDLVVVRNRLGTTLPTPSSFNYPTFSNTAGLDFFGDAARAGDTLRLVPASEHHNGAVRRQGVQNLSQGFSTSFTFRYANVGGILDDAGNHGTDGIAFTIQPVGSGAPVLAGGGLSIWFDAYRDGSDVSSSRVGVYRDGSLVAQFDAEALGIRYREGAAHTAQIDSSGSAIAIRLDGHLLGQVAANVGDAGLVGFAGFAGEAYADQELSNWSFRPTALSQPAVVVADLGRIIATPRKSVIAGLADESGGLV